MDGMDKVDGRALLVAHRGVSSLSPENTLQAARAAARLGVRAWEFDIYLTRDGEAALMHDATPDRTTNIRELLPERAGTPVGDFTLAELRRLDAASGFVRSALADRLNLPPLAPEPVPSLDEALLLARETNLLVFPELKGDTPRLADVLADKLERHGMVEQAIAISFHLDSLRRLKQRLPSVRIMPLYGKELPPDPVKALRELSACGMDVFLDNVTPSYAQTLRAAGYSLNVWTVNKTADMRRMAALGADYITTDTPYLAPAAS